MEYITEQNEPTKKGLRGIHVFWIVIGTMLVTAALTFWAVRTYLYAGDFKPVQLDQKEEVVLHGKLRALGYEPETRRAGDKAGTENDQQWLRAERYSEAGANSTIDFSERELNALLTQNPEMARRMAVDLSDERVSARLLVPVDPEFPLLGGKTLRVSAGIDMSYRDGRPKIMLKGVSVMGVPIPNSWLGGLKNVDLIGEFGDEQGFWSAFAQGVEDIQVQDGKLSIRLKP